MPLGNQGKSILAMRAAKEEAAKEAANKAHLAESKAKEEAARSKLKTTKELPPTSEKDLFDLINWIYSIPYSRRLTFIPRDFSDGVLVAEIIKHFVPELVDLHNYPSFCGRKGKAYNWEVLNKKVFNQLGFKIGKTFIDSIVSPKRFNVHDVTPKCYPIEKFLVVLREKLFKVNPKVLDYRANPSQFRLDPFKKKEVKKDFRPLTAQPMSETMWKIEHEAAEKYGEYKGNPITWDNLPELDEEAAMAQASIGMSKQKFLKYKLDKKLSKLKAKENKNVSLRDQEFKEDNYNDGGMDMNNYGSESKMPQMILEDHLLQTSSYDCDNSNIILSEQRIQDQECSCCFPPIVGHELMDLQEYCGVCSLGNYTIVLE